MNSFLKKKSCITNWKLVPISYLWNHISRNDTLSILQIILWCLTNLIITLRVWIQMKLRTWSHAIKSLSRKAIEKRGLFSIVLINFFSTLGNGLCILFLFDNKTALKMMLLIRCFLGLWSNSFCIANSRIFQCSIRVQISWNYETTFLKQEPTTERLPVMSKAAPIFPEVNPG